MRQPEWLVSWWECFQPNDSELFVLTARDEHRLLGLLPFYRLKSQRQLRLLGDGDVCTDYNGLLCAPDHDQTMIVEALSTWLIANCNDSEVGWESIYMEGIPDSDTTTRSLYNVIAQRGGQTLERNPMNTWCLDLTDGWDGYLARSSKDTRKRLRRRFESLAEVQIHQVQSKADWDRYFPILIDLHQKRRNSLGEPGCFADARFQSFLELASLRLLPLGQLQAFYLEKDGMPIAADIGFRSRTHWYCYQGGIEPSAIELEPGKMANIWMIHQTQPQGLRALDFLRGDEPYKKQLKADPQGMSDLWLASPGWKGLSKKWLWQSQTLLTNLARDVYQSIPLTK
jgi:CelD/BcsL family acetyltransferase involved in cellulose biosynthesis